MLVLLINELVAFASRKVEHHLLVDTRFGVHRVQRVVILAFTWYLMCSQGERDVEIRFDVVFHLLKCSDLDIKAEDSKGMSYDPTHVVAHKVPMLDGVEAVSNQEAANGCRMYGVLGVKKASVSRVRLVQPSSLSDPL